MNGYDEIYLVSLLVVLNSPFVWEKLWKSGWKVNFDINNSISFSLGIRSSGTLATATPAALNVDQFKFLSKKENLVESWTGPDITLLQINDFVS